MMKKLVLSILALLAGPIGAAASTSSAIILSGGGVVAPAGILSISLSPLLKDVRYNLSCQVTNSQADTVDMRFEPSQTSMYGQISLNETVLDNLQGSLQSGENTLVVNEVSVSGRALAALQFKNLDFAHSVQVSNCLAKPSIKQTLKGPTSGGGSFIAYTIYPHSSRWVFVSTDNQNITISNIY